MDISFSTKKIEKNCSSKVERTRHFGPREGDILGRRLDDLRAAMVLEDMRNLPGRCHELTGDRKGQLALDLVHPHRLIFEVADSPVPRKADKGLDWAKAASIKILEIEQDYH